MENDTEMILQRVYSSKGELIEEHMIPWTPPRK